MSKIVTGKVIGLKMAKTVVVEIETKKPHPLYKKIMKKTKKVKAHYEKNSLSEGDSVEIREVKPISKTKHWVVVKKVER